MIVSSILLLSSEHIGDGGETASGFGGGQTGIRMEDGKFPFYGMKEAMSLGQQAALVRD